MQGLFMKSKAHRLSQKYNIDPIYSADESIPENVYSDSLPQWLYAPYEYEAFMLEKLVRRKDAAKLKVGYTSFRRQVHERVIFERTIAQAGVFRFRASGEVDWRIENCAEGKFPAGDGEYEIPDGEEYIPYREAIIGWVICGWQKPEMMINPLSC